MTEEELEMDDVVVPNLDEEGDFAADYLEELLDIADLDGDIEISVEADRAAVAIVADDGGDRRLKRLIGKRGESLDALQELTRLAVQSQTGMRSRLMLDVLGYREGHRKEIQEIAREAVAKVLASGEDVSLKPMNPFERKVVHDVVAAAGLFSDSSGFGVGRHVVISLRDDEEIEDHDDDQDSFADDEDVDSAE
ncbi:spoIIIJ-associated protein [Arcanobacterium pluranimalium]|uniref:Jag family protein n=1 Tax=Arcanobacterium pluranimalium TaxID=108028 RepID=UPI001959D6ED|nr:R3H domain-containing nucleic acid-binding protein [Arcanobacterium pluranimalium]MBM7824446.1 spoIIIJ-associated protein [Arcanobacterium pluranimalium]